MHFLGKGTHKKSHYFEGICLGNFGNLESKLENFLAYLSHGILSLRQLGGVLRERGDHKEYGNCNPLLNIDWSISWIELSNSGRQCWMGFV